MNNRKTETISCVLPERSVYNLCGVLYDDTHLISIVSHVQIIYSNYELSLMMMRIITY